MSQKPEIQDIYPLSYMQRGMLFHSLGADHSSAYFQQAEFTIKGLLSMEWFQQSLDAIMQKYDVFRTVFVHQNIQGITEPRQVVLTKRQSVVIHEDICHLSKAAQSLFIDDYKVKDQARGFDLSKDVLLRVHLLKLDEDMYKCIWSHHHILMDGWCLGIVLQDFMRVYQGLANGLSAASISRNEAVQPYSTYIKWLMKRDKQASTRFWEMYLSNYSKQAGVPGFRKTGGETYKRDTVLFHLEESVIDRLAELAKVHQVTLSTIFQTIWGILLQIYNNTDDVIFGSIVSGRPSEIAGIEQMVGLFINTIPMRITGRHMSFSELTRKVQEAYLSAESHVYHPIYETQSLSVLKNELFNHVISFENFPVDALMDRSPSPSESGFTVEAFTFSEQTHYDFDLTIGPGKSWFVKMGFNANRFDRASIRLIEGHFKQAILCVLDNRHVAVNEIEIVTGSEKKILMDVFNDTAMSNPQAKKTIHQWFEEQADLTPERTAVVSGNQTFTYRQLEEKANQIAAGLLDNAGIHPDTLIGILMDNRYERVAAILGVLKSGGAYVPLDPELPEGRLTMIMKDAGIQAVVSTKRHAPLLERLHQGYPEFHAYLLCESDETGEDFSAAYPKDRRPPGSRSEHLAYVIYTSGTTGKPKGVMVEHRSLANLCQWHKQHYQITEADHSTLYAGFSFDASVWELFPYLVCGAAVYVVPADIRMNIEALNEFYEKNSITVSFLPTQLCEQFMEADNRSLRILLTGGDQLRQYKPNSYTLVNNYGPTENTVVATCSNVDQVANSIPIGKPIANCRIYVLGEGQKLLPIGAPGELCIAGAGLARGYLHLPEMTSQRFVQDPFYEGERMYRTGDIARWRPDGQIEYLGRLDHQIKVRGYRIELAEIESQLLQVDGVHEAVVVAKEDKHGQNQLYAYVVACGGLQEIKACLSQTLPQFMMPAYWVQLERMPLTAGGKIDRKALPESLDLSSDEAYAPPRTSIEKVLVHIWQDVLDCQTVGINDNFFYLGGDSIKAIQVASRLQKERYKLEINDLFRYPTISMLSSCIRSTDPQISQLPVEGEVYLTPVQRSYLAKSFDSLHGRCQSVLIYKEDGFNERAIKAAWAYLLTHHDVLRTVFLNENNRIMQWIGGTFTEREEGFLFKDFVVQDTGNDLENIRAAELEMRSGIQIGHGPLTAIGLIHTTNGEYLSITIHQLLLDNSSWSILLHDFHDAYMQTLRGEEISLPNKTTSFKEWSEAWHKMTVSRSSNGKPLKSRGTRHAERSLSKYQPDSDDRSETSLYSVSMSQGETLAMLHESGRAYHTEPQDILVTALMLSITQWEEFAHFTVEVEGNGRRSAGAELRPDRTVGNFTTKHVLILHRDGTDDLGHHFKTVKEALRQLHKLGEAEDSGSYDFGFSYLGEIDNWRDNREGFSISAFMPESKPDQRLFVHAIVRQEQLQVSFVYKNQEMNENDVKQISVLFLDCLRQLIHHSTSQTKSEYTPSDYGSVGAQLTLEGLQQWRDELSTHSADAAIQAIYPLSPLQEGMLFHALYEPDSLAYFDQLGMTIEEEVDISVVEQSLAAVCSRHDIMRTVFRHSGKTRPLQAVLQERPLSFHYEDLRRMSGEAGGRRIEEYGEQDKAKGFDLARDTLIRFALFQMSNKQYRLIWSYHHILIDGWCLGILLKEFHAHYVAHLHGTTAQLPPAPPYGTYIEWLEQQDQEASIGYWREYLADYNQRAVLPVQTEQVMAAGYELGVLEFTLDASLTAGLEDIVRRNQTTLSTVLQAIWGLMLATYNHSRDVVFGTIVSGRPAELEGVETMVGLFINAIPVRMQLEPSAVFSELLQQVQQRALETAAHDYVSLAEIQAQSELKGDLLHHLFVFENYPLHMGADGQEGEVAEGTEGTKDAEAGFVIRDLDLFEQTNYDFTLVVMPAAALKIKFSYNAQVYAPAAMEQIREHLLTLAGHVTQRPEGKLSELGLLTEEQQRKAPLALSAMDVPYADNMMLDELVSEQAKRTPEQIAVIHGEQQMSYAELEDWSNRWSHHLVERGVQPGDRVGLSVQRGMLSVIGMLAILKAGAAYVPLDPEDPKERKQDVMRRAELVAVVTDAEADFADEAVAVVRLDHSATALRCANSRPEVQRSSRDLAYIIFTSGSTGVPKGVMIEHHAAVNLISWVNQTYEVGTADRLLWITSLSFDLSVYDILGVLAAGGSVVVAQKDAVRDPQELKRLLVAERITLWDSVPTTMSYLVQSIENDAAAAPWQQTDLRLVLVSGDWIPVNLKTRMSGVFPQAQLIGLGGATEATVWSNYYPIHTVSEEQRSIPYGKPLANNVFYILDPFGLPVPAGVRGELFIGGVGVARGYAGDRDKTEQAFVPNPFRLGESMYRTGDLGRLLPDGNMEFLGRKDHQVKVRGFRVELGEIEYWLRQHADIEEAVVLCIDSGGREQLCAYVVPTRDVEAAEVREHLAKHLPAYMLPSHLLCIPELPLTANGKIDRKALPAPESVQRGTVQEPQSKVEKQLAAIWQEVLGVKQVSVEDDFFLLGGHSLLAATLVARLAAETGVELPLPFIFRYPTVGQLAERIEEMQLFRGEADTPVTLLQQGREGTIFCFPPVGGYGFEYKELAMQLPSHTWYAFDFITDSDLLHGYVKWITELQAEGPYVLLGYSAGGNLAYEVGKELEAQGHLVSGIVILDAMRRMEAEAKTQEEIEQETEEQLRAAESRYGEIVKVPSIRKEAALRMNAYRSYLYGLVNEGSVKAPLYVITSEEEKSRATMEAYSERQVASSWSGSSRAELVHYTGHGSHLNMLQGVDLQKNADVLLDLFGAFKASFIIC